MAGNPFRYLQPVEPGAFVGRWPLVEQIASDAALEVGDSYAIIGGRRCGKTSFLNTLGHRVARTPLPPEDDYVLVPVFYDLKGFADQAATAGEVWALILKSIRHSVSPEEGVEPDGAWPRPVELNAPWFREAAALKELRDLSDFTQAVGYVVSQLGAELKHPARLMLLLDEVDEALDQPWSSAFLNQLRALTSSEVKSKVRLVLAGSEHLLKQLSTRGSPLFNILKREYLEALDRAAFDELTARCADLGEEVKEAVWNQSGGHPFLAQYLLHYVLDAGAEAGSAAVVDEVVWKFCSEQFTDLEGWARAVGDAGLGAFRVLPASGGWIDEDDIFKVVGHTPAETKQGLTALCYHGLALHRNGWRSYSRTANLFRVWCEKFKFGDLTGASGTASNEDGRGDKATAGTHASSVSEPRARRAVNTPAWPRKNPFNPQILVMKGGGVKGIAYVGALEVLNEYGYHFEHYVGTSAGAITAALLAVGYSPRELGEILARTNFKKFKDGWLLFSLPLLVFRKGLYRGEAFRVWLEDLLRAKFPQYADVLDIRFSHLAEISESRRLSVFASVKGRRSYCFDSKNAATSKDPISFACRCSMAIPYFFMPEKIAGQWVVDGGTQNNYPVYSLLSEDFTLKDSADFLGLYLGHKKAKRNTEWLLLNLFSIWSESGDEEAKTEFIDRTIIIDPRPVKTTDFSLSENDVEFLLAEGKASALHWLYYWGDGKRPSLEIVAEAERESARLRALIFAERWRRFLPKLILAILLLPVIPVWYFLKPPTGPDARGARPPLPSPTTNDAGSVPTPLTTPSISGNIRKVQTPSPGRATAGVNSNQVGAPTPTPVTFVLSSRVFDGERPVKGARVSIVGSPEHGMVETDANGAFAFDGVRKKLNEKVQIRVEHDGKTEEFPMTVGSHPPMLYLRRTK